MKDKTYSRRLVMLLTAFAGLCATHTSAQEIIRIKAGEDMSSVYKQMYRFPQFMKGKVYFMNKDSASGKLNYNMVIGKMQFIDRKGDTLVLSDNNPVRLVAIDTNLFYCNSTECVELVAGFPPAELAVSHQLKLLDEQKIGAYGLPSSTQSIENSQSYKANAADYRLQLNKDLVFTKESRYYLIDGDKHYLAANKKNLQKLFPKQKNVIEKYIDEHPVDFKNESDLKNIFLYLAKDY